MRKILMLFLLVVVVVPTLLPAVTPPSIAPPPQGSFFTTLQNTFSGIIITWQPYLRGVANKLLFSLGTIQIALIGMKLILQENIELNTILGELVRFIILAGFLYWLVNATYTAADGTPGLPILQQILESFIKIAKNVDPAIPGGFNMDDMMGYIHKLVKNVQESTGFWSTLLHGVGPIVITMISIVVVTKAVTAALKNYVFALLAIQVAPIFLAASILEYTRSWALSNIILVIKYSMKFMALTLVIYLVFGLFRGALNPSFTDGRLLVILALSVIMLELVKGAEGIVEGLFSGSDHNKGSLAASGLR